MRIPHQTSRNQKSLLFSAVLIAFSTFLLTAVLFGICGFSLFKIDNKYIRTDWKEPPADSFYVYSAGDELSHSILWYAIGESIDNAKRASVLVVGDSRSQLGLLASVIQPLADARGCAFFWLSTGHGEGIPFFYELIKKHNMSNKVVIVQYESLLRDKPSRPARAAMEKGYWSSLKDIGEQTIGWILIRHLHSCLPKNKYTRPSFSDHVLYRSSKTGGWSDLGTHSKAYPVSAKARDCKQGISPVAERFLQLLKLRGMTPVITSIPDSYGSSYEAAKEFAASRNMVFISPQLPGLTTYDENHLSFSSAVSFSIAFWNEFQNQDFACLKD